ncbi:lysosomal acid lipase cholesteryl ester hydrolase-like [Brachionus plicatilis]|uniref:Lipase n=1 Tax=Brachionus plicatilis TaxID=10195 RepID=A0A3M7SRN2_BRAPC|nr:lysosomal acid lipase cholesteryl ester hydrolase-like [Brachionus plicatilis]
MFKNILKILILILFSNSNESNAQKFPKSDIDEYINTTTLIKSKGYPCEEHDVLTKDGYILSINRIPYSPNEVKKFSQKKIVLLQHGLLDASSAWVINFPEQSLGFILSDAGYDVWLGNMRGNKYGLRHKHLKSNQSEFWDFSWSDMAKYDLTALIDYVLQRTSQKDLIYVGHSQGTLIGLAEFGANLALAEKIKLFVALGPVSTVKHIKSPIRYIANMGTYSNQNVWFKLFGRRDFLPSSNKMNWLADKLCNLKVTDRIFCANLLFLLCGPSKYMNQSRIAVYFTHEPAGTSVKNLAHFGQAVISGKFQMYDYGPALNKQRYNQSSPPLYDISKMHVPTALYWAKNDWLADPVDVEFIRNSLPKIVDDYEIMDWDHLDFLLATNAKECLYDRILKLIKKYAKI